jgi:hypothetical protein
MRFRVGLVDVIAALVVAAAILVPDPSTGVESAYGKDADAEVTARIDALQTQLAREPGDGKAAEELGQIFERLRHQDQALRIGGEASTHDSPTRWRAFVAVWSAHADRLRYTLGDGDGAAEELQAAVEWADKADAACRESADCKNESPRLMLYRQALQAGADWLKAGGDPVRDLAGFRAVLMRSNPTATVRGGK